MPAAYDAMKFAAPKGNPARQHNARLGIGPGSPEQWAGPASPPGDRCPTERDHFRDACWVHCSWISQSIRQAAKTGPQKQYGTNQFGRFTMCRDVSWGALLKARVQTPEVGLGNSYHALGCDLFQFRMLHESQKLSTPGISICQWTLDTLLLPQLWECPSASIQGDSARKAIVSFLRWESALLLHSQSWSNINKKLGSSLGQTSTWASGFPAALVLGIFTQPFLGEFSRAQLRCTAEGCSYHSPSIDQLDEGLDNHE